MSEIEKLHSSFKGAIPGECLFSLREFKTEKFICLHPVMAGWRIRAGYIGYDIMSDSNYGNISLDYCAGDKMVWIELVYNLVYSLIAAGIEFEKFPLQLRKPAYNDPDFIKELSDLYDKLDSKYKYRVSVSIL